MIAQRYLIEEEIGIGGMGSVFRALDTYNGSTVALKHLRPELSTPEMLERFRREGEILRTLNHPNIITMLDLVRDEDGHYLVMEYIAGGDLIDLIDHEELTTERIIKIGIDLADALTRAHKLDIIHRDLKPANILIADDGTIRLTDFGVAHIGRMDRVTDSRIAIGTLHYLPPEALSGQEIDNRADIWSFGVLLYEMLTGQHPFVGTNPAHIIANILTQPLPDLEKIRPDLPIPLVDLIYRMLIKERSTRIASIRHVGAMLEDILEGRVTTGSTRAMLYMGDSTANTRIRRHNLPANTTPFIGRERELQEVNHLLTENRLLTIIAPGGMGKTRLAIESGTQQLDNFLDGVYLVELAPLSSVDDIIPTIADAVGFQFFGSNPPAEQLHAYFYNKQMLLIMDNYEHLLEGVDLLHAILQAAPDVKILATSRSRLNLRGEVLFTIGGMDFPDWETPEDALDYSAVKLFLQSARRVKPTFELNKNNLDYVARICRLVQGMPLGIELAAAWLEVLTPQEVVEEISESLDFLELQTNDLPARQRSIRAVFDYSWNLLTDAERSILMRLAVFRGGFSRSAAQTVTGASLRDLMTLVNKSLLWREPDTGDFDIHEVLRQFATGYLDESGSAATVKDAHSAYYLQQLADRRDEITDKRALTLLYDIEVDVENMRVAALWSAQQGHYEQLNAALRTLWFYYHMRGQGYAGVTLLEQIAMSLWGLPQATARDEVICHVMACRAYLLTNVMLLTDATNEIEGARALLREDCPLDLQAFSQLTLGLVYSEAEFAQDSRQYLEEALRLYREMGDDWGEAEALRDLGNSYWYRTRAEGEDWSRAQTYLEQAYEIQKARGDVTNIARTLMNLATVNSSDKRLSNIELLVRRNLEAYEYSQRAGNKRRSALILMNLGIQLMGRGQMQSGRDYMERCLALHIENGDRLYSIWALTQIANSYYHEGALDDAISKINDALVLLDDTTYQEWLRIARVYKGNVYCAKGDYDEAQTLYQSALKLSREHVQHQRSFDYSYLAFVQRELGKYDQARQYLAQADEQAPDSMNNELRSSLAVGNAFLAYEEQRYPDVLRMLEPIEAFYTAEDTLDKYPELSYVQTLYLLVLALCALQRVDEAEEHMLQLLRKCQLSNSRRMQPLALTAYAYYLSAHEKSAEAAEIAATVVNDPMAFDYLRRHPRQLLQQLGGEPPTSLADMVALLKTLTQVLDVF